jgi:hypothetical protein
MAEGFVEIAAHPESAIPAARHGDWHFMGTDL